MIHLTYAGRCLPLIQLSRSRRAKGSAGRKTLASFCLNPIGSSRGQSLLVSEAFSCATEKDTTHCYRDLQIAGRLKDSSALAPPPVSVPYTSLSTGLRLDTFRMKLRHRRWSGASGTSAQKPQCVAGQAGARNAPLGFNRTRPVDRLSEERDRRHMGVSQSRRIATVRPRHSDPTVDYSVECNRSKRVSITGPRCKTHCRLQGRTVPLYLNHDRSGENNPQ